MDYIEYIEKRIMEIKEELAILYSEVEIIINVIHFGDNFKEGFTFSKDIVKIVLEMYENQNDYELDEALIASYLLIAYDRQIKLLNVRARVFQEILNNLKNNTTKE